MARTCWLVHVGTSPVYRTLPPDAGMGRSGSTLDSGPLGGSRLQALDPGPPDLAGVEQGPGDVLNGTDVHAVPELLVGDRVDRVELERLGNALEPGRLPWRDTPLARPDDRGLGDGDEGGK